MAVGSGDERGVVGDVAGGGVLRDVDGTGVLTTEVRVKGCGGVLVGRD